MSSRRDTMLLNHKKCLDLQSLLPTYAWFCCQLVYVVIKLFAVLAYLLFLCKWLPLCHDIKIRHTLLRWNANSGTTIVFHSPCMLRRILPPLRPWGKPSHLCPSPRPWPCWGSPWRSPFCWQRWKWPGHALRVGLELPSRLSAAAKQTSGTPLLLLQRLWWCDVNTVSWRWVALLLRCHVNTLSSFLAGRIQMCYISMHRTSCITLQHNICNPNQHSGPEAFA